MRYVIGAIFVTLAILMFLSLTLTSVAAFVQFLNYLFHGAKFNSVFAWSLFPQFILMSFFIFISMIIADSDPNK